MLIASPYNSFDRGFDAPKIISGIRKRDIISPTPNIRPKLTGDLLVKCGPEKNWWPRRVNVKGGHLVVSSRRSDDPLPTLRLPLRQLSLQAGPLVNSLSLTKGPIVVLTIQTSTEQNFDLWVKAIAIELIRQTPLFAVKYLDILSLTESSKKKNINETNYKNEDEILMNEKIYANKENYLVKNAENGYDSSSSSSSSSSNEIVDGRINEEKTVETILKKCQNVENYVPVKEKLVLFESLCRLGRKVRSSEDVSYRNNVETKRARSMHDLSNFGPPIAVREICKYFENKNDTIESKKFVGGARRNKRLVCSDSQLDYVKKLPEVLKR